MSYKEELLKKQEEIVGGNKLEFPLTKVQIDHEKGQWRIGGKKVEGEWKDAEYQEQIEFIFLKRYSEYYFFNGETERIEKRSTIEELARDCVELYSKVPISELKEAGYKMTFQSHLVGLLKTSNGFICADLPLKGSAFKSFLDFTTAEKNYLKNRLLYKIQVSLEKKKKGVITYYVPVFDVVEVTDEEAKQILGRADECVEKFEEFRKEYNTKTRKSEKREESEEVEDFSSEIDEDIPF